MTKLTTRINWEDYPVEAINCAQWNELVARLEKEFGPQTKPKPGCRYKTTIKDTTWWIEGTDKIYFFDPDTCWPRRVWCGPQNQINPTICWNELRQRIQQEYGKGMEEVWGKFDSSLWALRCCVPSQISWSASKYHNLPLEHIYKADISSAFPYEACKRLPTLIGSHMVTDERPMPDKDFPFVFGSDGSLIFIEEDGTIIDTNSIVSSRFYGSQAKYLAHQAKVAADNNYKPLSFSFWLKCPAGPSLAKVMEPLYAAKQAGDETAKQIMNQFIGFCWRKDRPSFLHLAAVILARCDNRIITRAERLIDRGAIPVLIATDSIAWIGKGNELVVTNADHKKLGMFAWEAQDCEMFIAGPKVYQLRDKDRLITRWAGVAQEDTENMPFGAVAYQTPKVQIFNPTTNKYEDITTLLW